MAGCVVASRQTPWGHAIPNGVSPPTGGVPPLGESRLWRRTQDAPRPRLGVLFAPFRLGARRTRGRRAGGVSPLEGGVSLLRSVTASVGRAAGAARVGRGAAAYRGIRPATRHGDDAHTEAGRGHGAIGSLAPGAYAAPEGEVAETASPAFRPARLRQVREFRALAGPVAPPRRPFYQPGRVCRGHRTGCRLGPGRLASGWEKGGATGPRGMPGWIRASAVGPEAINC